MYVHTLNIARMANSSRSSIQERQENELPTTSIEKLLPTRQELTLLDDVETNTDDADT